MPGLSGASRMPFPGLRSPSSWTTVVAKIKGANAFQSIGALQHLRLTEASNSIAVPGQPVLLHCPAGELEVLCNTFVFLTVIDQVNDIADLLIRLWSEQADLRKPS